MGTEEFHNIFKIYDGIEIIFFIVGRIYHTDRMPVREMIMVSDIDKDVYVKIGEVYIGRNIVCFHLIKTYIMLNKKVLLSG